MKRPDFISFKNKKEVFIFFITCSPNNFSSYNYVPIIIQNKGIREEIFFSKFDSFPMWNELIY